MHMGQSIWISMNAEYRRQQRRRSELWVDDNRDGLVWGEVVDVVESGARKGRERKGAGD